ncbi:hypothetical protein M2651_06890 [Clostridium sp. SYSU_GA19001]|uniref:hypothetical protein n=1 Tax=Clostridium caldaquaticum TaxID=2940653 RepID=UPI0020778295|nr:hypothetical protein [Clostridium caldaquaticum]MCM8710753.1 hypothetical protein [Clostridium caldaquaticum]
MSRGKVGYNNVATEKKEIWSKFREKHPELAQFIVFLILSNGITVLQMVLMPVIKGVFEHTALINTNFQVFKVGNNLDGSPYYVFNYAAGSIAAGGGGGLAYFLAVQITLAVAQIINFFVQRNITFKSNGNIWEAAFWYVVAYIVISISAAAFQGLYKAPIYNFFMNTLELGSVGVTIADFITIIINCAISFWVFYPIFKIIFKRNSEK